MQLKCLNAVNFIIYKILNARLRNFRKLSPVIYYSSHLDVFKHWWSGITNVTLILLEFDALPGLG